jgi:hypothetical protein
MIFGWGASMRVAARESFSMSVMHEHAAGLKKERAACLERQRLVCGVLVQMRRCCPQRPISQCFGLLAQNF